MSASAGAYRNGAYQSIAMDEYGDSRRQTPSPTHSYQYDGADGSVRSILTDGFRRSGERVVAGAEFVMRSLIQTAREYPLQSSAVVIVILIMTMLTISSPYAPSTSSSSPSKISPHSSSYTEPQPPTLVSDFEQSPNDERQYRGITLANKLQCLLISDGKAGKASAAMAVNAGFDDDPDDTSGLAHFVEHMLFMGTKQFPSEDEYSQFLNAHGGTANAFTADDRTVYFFSVQLNSLYQTLQRFSAFFIAPLFITDAVEREVKAIDSEHAKNIQSDEWRLEHLLRHTSNPAFPFHHFGTGNLATLSRADATAQLRDFFLKHYSANRMRLVVLGRDSLDDLQAMVHELFADIPNNEIPPSFWSYKSEAFPVDRSNTYKPRQVLVAPIGHVTQLTLYWPLNSTTRDYFANPTRYVAYLLGHESEGSICYELKQRGWASTVSAGLAVDTAAFNLFQLNIKLTAAGLPYVDDIVALAYEYIDGIRATEGVRKVYDELQEMLAVQWRFAEKQDEMSYTYTLATRLIDVELADALLPPSRNYYDVKLIHNILNQLIPENMIVHIVSDLIDKSLLIEKDPIYGTIYQSTPINNDRIQHFIHIAHGTSRESMHLPEPNPFILSTDFTYSTGAVESAFATEPTHLVDDAMTSLWYRHDNTFKLPKAFICFDLLLPAFLDSSNMVSPQSVTALTLYTQLVSASFASEAYYASLIGYSYTIAPIINGVRVSVSGYTPKLQTFLVSLATHIFTLPDLTPILFNVTRTAFIDGLINLESSNAYEQALYTLSTWINQGAVPKEQMIAFAKDITYKGVVGNDGLISRFFEYMRVDMLVYGDMTQTSALQSAASLWTLATEHHRTAPMPETLLAQLTSVQLRAVNVVPHGDWYVQSALKNINDMNSVTLVHVPVSNLTDLESSITADILLIAIRQECFDVLRTRQQLGYIVACFLSNQQSSYRSFNILIQSATHSPDELITRIQSFFTDFSQTLQSMTSETFTNIKQSVMTDKRSALQSMDEQVNRDWTEITTFAHITKPVFNRIERECAAIDALKQSALVDLYQRAVLNRDSRRRLIVEMWRATVDMTTTDTSAHILSSKDRAATVRTWKKQLKSIDGGSDDDNDGIAG